MNGKRFLRLFVLMAGSSYVAKEVTDFTTVTYELSFYLNRFCLVLKLLSPILKQKECAQTRISERYVKLFEATRVLAFLGATESCCVSEWAFFSWIPLRHQTIGPWNVRIYLPCTNVTRVRLCPRRHTCISSVCWFSSLLRSKGFFPRVHWFYTLVKDQPLT